MLSSNNTTIITVKTKLSECKTQEERDKLQIEKYNFKQYTKNLNKHIVTTRFNNSTWKENEQFREKNPNIGCIYAVPETVTQRIQIDNIMFVLEMNNDENKIMGVGMVKNHPHIGKYRVYSNGNYNRYSYIGKYRIDRTEMTALEEDVFKAFDIFCFKSPFHMKRGQGLRAFPLHILYNCIKVMDLVEFIIKMFKARIK